MTPEELEGFLHASIPVSGLMQIGVEACAAGEIILSAPLSANYNHLGTAFGGSLSVVATLAGYCALWQALGDKDAHIVIRRSNIEYLRPVTGDIRATCTLEPQELTGPFIDQFRKRGKARMNLHVSISENDVECVRFRGEFVAIS